MLGRRLGCLCALLPLGLSGAAAAQDSPLAPVARVYLDDVVGAADGERAVQVYFRAVSPRGAPVKGLVSADVEVWQDGRALDVEDVEVESLEGSGLGVALVLALDASGTMRGEPFERTVAAAVEFVERLEPEDRIAVLSFAENVVPVADFELSRTELLRRLRALEVDPSRSQRTRLHDGALEAIEQLRRAPQLPPRASVILISDGGDGGSQHRAEQVIERAADASGASPVLLFSIGYPRFGGRGLEELRALAEAGGGQFLQAEPGASLGDFLDSIAIQLRSSYRLRFAADLDGEAHEIRLAVQEREATRSAVYPRVLSPLWPWLGALGALLLAGGGGWWFLERRRVVGRLVITSGAKAGMVYELRRTRTRIGSLDDNEIVIPTGGVSRYHAEISARGGAVQISDLQSTNGTQVNGKPIQSSPLRSGDRIEIADVEFLYER